MKTPLPMWSIPVLLALVGIVALIGHLDTAVLVVIGIEVVLVSAYVILQSRTDSPQRQPSSNLLALFPGHLLVLIIVALLDQSQGLAWLWTFIPPLTIAYDAVGRNAALSSLVRKSISMILYVILWTDLFFLLERAVVLHRQISGEQAIMIAAGFGVFGALFLSLGVYRHWIAAKE